jgi:hypothetical protein
MKIIHERTMVLDKQMDEKAVELFLGVATVSAHIL